MSIDWTINVGAILGGLVSGVMTIGAVVRLYYAMDRRLGRLEDGIVTHAERIEAVTDKQTEHERRLVDIIADIAGLLGIVAGTRVQDAPWRQHNRRSTDKLPPEGGPT